MPSITESLGLFVGLTLCVLVGGQTVYWGFSSWKRKQQAERTRHTQLLEFRDQVKATQQRVRAEKMHLAWIGTREMHVSAIVEETNQVKSFYLTATDGQYLASFLPGQYLTFDLNVPGCGKPVVRCYSLSDQPHPDYYRCTIKRVPAPAGRIDIPPGLGSNFFHDHVRTGHLLQVQAPRGSFFLDPVDEGPIVLIAGGIGITPILSMVLTLAETDCEREGFVFCQMRNGDEFPLDSALKDAINKMPNMHLVISHSNPLDNEQQGIDYHRSGRLDIAHIREVLPANNYRYYLCGPGAMMESLVPALEAWGVPETHIFYEAFGPASINAKNSTKPLAAPCDVRFNQSEETHCWTGTEDTLLDFCESNGIAADVGCRAGNCGQCLTRIVQGDVNTIKQPGVPVEKGHCLLCISVPTEAIILDA